MNRKKKSPAHQQLGNPKSKLHDINLSAQRQRLLLRLREKPISTIEARRDLNILSPAARIFELRHEFWFNVQTTWIKEFTPEGHRHRVAKYVLISGRYKVGRH